MPSGQPAKSRARRLPSMPASIVIVLGLMVILSAIGYLSSPQFFTLRNWLNIFDQSAAVSIVSLGQTLVVLTGGIDLSIGSMVSLLSVLTSGLIDNSPEMIVAVCAGAVVAGTVIGMINGLIVAKTNIHPLIVTLGSGVILQGSALLYSMTPTGGVPAEFGDIAYGRIYGVPAAPLVVLLVYLFVFVVLKYVYIGRVVYAVGESPHSSIILGLPYTTTIVAVYMASGLFCSIAAIYLVSRFGVGQPYAGENLMLSSITPVVLGGTLLTGGRGGVIGTLLACYLLVLLNNILNYMDVSTYIQMMAQGVIIAVAVSFQFNKGNR